ncbi:hypothetical protein MRQ36_28100 [Micromonospora sp. R77]|uniref:hypothetical protein n=1 Tax=Micromonospora sp. R77 TaxID=2925836 RepID=UPI001F612924|nr:hypothetical protein [Micromonospora sp. R77]MCI4066203.1 hypothetical protein [Micromonospora sp. R77]
MNLRIHVHQARLGPAQYRVIRPATPLTGAVLGDENPWHVLELDADAAFAVTGLWMLAARSRHTLVHLPLRGNAPPEPSRAIVSVGELDLVLSHRDLQFAPHRWKQLRHRLGPGAPQTVAWNPNDVPSWDEVHELNRQSRRGSSPRDRFHQRLHGNTLFLAGNAVAFRRTARYVLDLALRRPALGHSGTYHSATVHPADGHFATTGQGIYLIRWR